MLNVNEESEREKKTLTISFLLLLYPLQNKETICDFFLYSFHPNTIQRVDGCEPMTL